MTDRISVTPKIMELQNTNDIYMTMNLRILSATPNFNSAEFTEDFILNTVENKKELIGIPFVVDRESLESGEYSNLTHQLTSEGELKTDQIGSFVDFWSEKDEDGVLYLGGQVRIMKRFKKTAEAVYELFSEDSLNTSCEVMIESYQEISDEGIRKIHYNDGKNRLFASCLVTNPADEKAKASLLIAEAYQKDISSEQQGGENLSKEEKYNNGIKVELQSKLELFSIKPYEIEQQVYHTINPYDAKTGHREYNYYIHTLYYDKVILESESSYTLYSASYKVENDTVILDSNEKWKKGSYQFVPEGISVNELIEQNTDKIQKLNKELSELKEEKEKMSKKKELTVDDLNEKIEKLETEISDLKETNEKLEGTIVAQKEVAVKTEKTVTELNSTIEDLKGYKKQVETAEKEIKVAELNAKYSTLLSEEVFKAEETTKLINELDESGLNSLVVAEISKQKEVEIETASAQNEDVVIAASKQEDLVESTILEKYNLA